MAPTLTSTQATASRLATSHLSATPCLYRASRAPFVAMDGYLPVLPSFPRDAWLARLGLVEGTGARMTSRHVQYERLGRVIVHQLPDAHGSWAVSVLFNSREVARIVAAEMDRTLQDFPVPETLN